MNDRHTISPCPFCGGELSYDHFDISGEHEFECNNCSAVISFDVDLTEEEAIKACNERYLILELLEALRGADILISDLLGKNESFPGTRSEIKRVIRKAEGRQ